MESNKNVFHKFNAEEEMTKHFQSFGEFGGVNKPIEVSTTFSVKEAETLPQIFEGKLGPEKGGCFLYGRSFNPSVFYLGQQLALMEGTEAAYCTSSGMGAISCTVLEICSSGDHIVSGNTIYGGTFALFNEFLPSKCNIKTSFVNPNDLQAVENAINEKTKMIYVESVSNPLLNVVDIPKLAEIAHKHHLKLVVDNTFSPLILTPAQLGADIVIYSMTKFINGTSDIIGGAVCGSHDFIISLMDLHMGSIMLLGPVMDPNMAYHIGTKLPHLGLRMKEHSRRALFFAEKLEALGLDIHYPGLKSHPQHSILDALRHEEYGYGGVIALDLGTKEAACKFLNLLQNESHFGYIAVSLGFSDTLMSCSAITTSSELSEEDRKKAKITEGLVRLSIGYTGTLEQRWEQFYHALELLNESHIIAPFLQKAM